MGILRMIKIFPLVCMVVLSVFVTLEYKAWNQPTDHRHRVVIDGEMSLRIPSVNMAANKSVQVVAPVAAIDEKLYSAAETTKRFRKRLNDLRGECKRRFYPPPSNEFVSNTNFLIDIPRRLLVCAVAKAGSTSWHRTIWAIRQKRNGKSTDQNLYTSNDTLRNTYLASRITQAEGVKLIRPVPGDENFWQVPPQESGFRVVLARHPFARLISGWNQKFLLKSNYWVHLFKTYKGLIDYRKHYDATHVMAFKDFAKYVAEKGSSRGSLDFHFTPAYVFCRPCSYYYTYILKAESVDIDEPWLKKRLNLTDLDVGRRGIPPGGSVVNGDVKESVKKYMSQLHPSIVKKLYNIYEKDFAFFGYTFNFTTLEAGGFE